jgi:hypothetical protein
LLPALLLTEPVADAVRPSNMSWSGCGRRVVIAVLRASLVAVLVAGVFAASGCSSSPGCLPGASCPAPPLPRVQFIATINGKSAMPTYRVHPGEYLVMRVAVIVPKHLRITALWLGISHGTWGSGPKGPIGMNPILAQHRQPLSAGSHTFGLRWRVPDRRSDARPYLTFTWSSHQPFASVSGAVAQLKLN